MLKFMQAVKVVSETGSACCHEYAFGNNCVLLMKDSTTVQGRTAADDLRDTLRHGATYLKHCHDPATNSLVSHVSRSGGDAPNPAAEWEKPESRQNADVRYVDAQNQGTETFAAVTAAFAALSIALKPFKDTDADTADYLMRAKQTFAVMQQSRNSYASLAENAQIAQSWPSDPANLADDKLLASAVMLLATGSQEYRCVFCACNHKRHHTLAWYARVSCAHAQRVALLQQCTQSYSTISVSAR
jgi:hypothetical protein